MLDIDRLPPVTPAVLEPLVVGLNKAVTEPLVLTDLREAPHDLRRLAHGYATAGTWRRLLYRVASTCGQVAAALPRDVARAMRPAASPLRIEDGTQNSEDTARLALYVHYSASGRVSDMVRHQLHEIRQLGFAIVFITMASNMPEDDWQAVRDLCALAVHRENVGLDFGAWHDLMPEVRRRWPRPVELMLANDSVLGPIYPLAPLIQVMRAGGDGLFGLTESRQGGPHLQSYLLLARGKAVIEDLMGFLQTLYISHSKWLVVQIGEIRLARWMRQRGHRVAALFGYERLVFAAVSDPAERHRLMASNSKLRNLDRLGPHQAIALLYKWPLNPTQHLWHVLVTKFGGPFLKTQLVLNNPGHLPGVERWTEVIPPESPCSLSMLSAHLATMTVG